MSTQQAPNLTAPPASPPSGSSRPPTGGSLAPRLLLIGLPLLVALFVGITRGEVYTALINSPQAIAIVAGIVAAVLGLSALLRKTLSNEWLITGLLLVPLAVVGYLFIAPYYAEDVVVDEALPGLDPAAAAPADEAAAPADDQADVDQSGVDQADVDQSTDDQSADDAVPDVTADDAAGTLEGAAADAEGEPDVAQPADVPADAPAPEPPAATTGPVQLTNGTFVGLDNHFAEGVAAIYELEDGSSIVRLEDVNLQQVPQAVVYLVPGADQTGLAGGSINLGALTGNVGSSNYAIPADVDLTVGDWTVLVWCEVFASPVGGASQIAAG